MPKRKKAPVDPAWIAVAEEILRMKEKRWRLVTAMHCSFAGQYKNLISQEMFNVAEDLRRGNAREACIAAYRTEGIYSERLFPASLWEIGVSVGCMRKIQVGSEQPVYQGVGFL